jgi:hypothetical protein
MSEQKGSFGIQGTGDTSGYGGLVRSSFSPTSAQKPYGSYFDEVTDDLICLSIPNFMISTDNGISYILTSNTLESVVESMMPL